MIVQFRLGVFPKHGSVGMAVKSWLEGYYVNNPAGLVFLDIEFNIKSQEEVSMHASVMDGLIEQLKKFVFVYNQLINLIYYLI